MIRSRRSLILAAVGLVTLVGAAPPHQLPPCLNSAFEGITETSVDGTVIGQPDARDWGCVDRGQGGNSAALSNQLRSTTGGPGIQGVPAPPPTAICMEPAAPNPANGATRIQFSLPASAQVTLSVYGRRQGHGPRETSVVRELFDGTLAPGTFTFYWDLSDDHDDPLPPGIYRVVLVVGDEALCGDVEVR